MMILESTTEIINPIVESTKDGFLRLRGILMQSEAVNRNGRIYPKGVMESVVKKFNENGKPIMGELEHPNTLTINLDRVSHLVEKLEMVDSDVVGQIKILNTPCGQTVRHLIEGGAPIGASSRGGGSVTQKNGIDEVSVYEFVTVDLVGSPSAYEAYPQAVTESVDSHKAFVESIHTPANQELLKRLLLGGLTQNLK